MSRGVLHRRFQVLTGTMLSMLVLLSPDSAMSDVAKIWNGPSFRAIQIDSDRKNVEDVSKTEIYVSQYGFKMVSSAVGLPTGGQLSKTIFLAKQDVGYLIIPDLKLYIDPENSEGTIAKDDIETGLLVTEPCVGFKNVRSLGPENLKSRKTTKWRCSNQEGVSEVIQHMDVELKCVIRSETADGRISELTDITMEHFSPDQFELPQGYRKGTMRELFSNPHTLPKYGSDAIKR